MHTSAALTESPPPLVRGSFLRALSGWSRLKLLGFVFFTFAPVSILLVSPFCPKRSWASLAAYAGFGGFTAAGWLYSCMMNRRAFWVLIPSQAFWFYLPRLFPQDFRTGFTLSVEGCACIAMIVLGYILFVSFFRSEGVRTARMQTELALAQQIHASLIPPIARTTARLELYGRSIAGAEMGGDLIDVVERDGRTDLFIADVSGHGVKAGVVMAVVKSAIRTRHRTAESLDELFCDVNAVVCELAGRGMFVTAAGLRLDGEGGASFCGAGHGPVLHFRAVSGRVEAIESEQLPLGVVEGEGYESKLLSLGAGDVLLFMTDGLTEVFSASDEMLGQGRIEELLSDLGRRPLPQIYDRIMQTVRAHGPQADDQTLLLARVL